MHQARLARRRMASQAPLLGAIFGLIVIVSALLTGIPRYLGVAEISSARASLAAADAADAAVQAQVRLAEDAAAQADQMQQVLDPLLAETAARVFRTLQSPPVDATLPDGSAVSMLLGADPELVARSQLVSGDYGGPALQATAAEELGLVVGDTVVVAGTPFEIAATWLPLDASDPYWFADSAVATGESAGSFGPLIVDEAQLAALDVNPFVRWTLVPDVDRLTAVELAPLAVAASTWEARIREVPELAAGGVVFAGGLAGTVSTVERSLASVQGVSPIPLVLAGVIGFIALLQLALLLAGVRADETFLLRARGRSMWRAALAGAVEGLVVSVPGVAIGTAVALLLVPGGTSSLLVPAVLAVVGVAVLAAIALNAARRAHAPGRASTGAAITVLALAVIAAVVSLWQFRLYGSPLITTADGDRVVDPVAVLAPSLGLVACAMIAVAALPVVAGAIAAAASRGVGLSRVLPARQVARRIATFAVAVLLVCLAVGGSTLAAGYSATWSALTLRAGELRNGSDVRVDLATSATVGGAASIVTSPPFTLESTVATPSLVAATESGEDSLSLVALSGAELPAVLATLGGTLDTQAIAAAMNVPAQGIELPRDASSLTLTAATTVTTVVPGAPTVGGQGTTALVAWVADAQGALARLPLEPRDDGSASAELPVGVAPWTVLAIDASVTTGPNAATYGVAIDAGDGAAGWAVQPEAGSDFEGDVGERADSLGFDLTVLAPGPAVLVRLMPAPSAPLTAVISDALAGRLGLVVGDPVQLRFAGSGLGVSATVAGTTPLVPGSTGSLGVIADLRALNEQVLRTSSSVPRPDQVWIATDDPAGTIAALSLPTGARVTTVDSGSGNALQRPVVLALWIGAAGALLLTAAAIAAVAGAMARARHPEVVALRALGVRNRAQAGSRAAELLLVVGIALVLGVIAGVGVSLLTVGELARSAVLDAPAALAATVQFDVVALVLALAGFVGLVAAVAAVYGARVRRQAATSTGREVAS